MRNWRSPSPGTSVEAQESPSRLTNDPPCSGWCSPTEAARVARPSGGRPAARVLMWRLRRPCGPLCRQAWRPVVGQCSGVRTVAEKLSARSNGCSSTVPSWQAVPVRRQAWAAGGGRDSGRERLWRGEDHRGGNAAIIAALASGASRNYEEARAHGGVSERTVVAVSQIGRSREAVERAYHAESLQAVNQGLRYLRHVPWRRSAT